MLFEGCIKRPNGILTRLNPLLVSCLVCPQPFEFVHPGSVSGNVTINDGSLQQHVTLSFIRIGACGVEDAEIDSLNVADGGTFGFDLPAGDYRVVTTTYYEATQKCAIPPPPLEIFEIQPGVGMVLDISLSSDGCPSS